MENKEEVIEIIKKRKITKLIHVTRKENLKSILNYGILSRDDLIKRNIDFKFNDNDRYDQWEFASCLSVTNLNPFLIKRFIERQKLNAKDFFEIHVKPTVLVNNECIFCDTNAASMTFNEYRKNPEKLDLLKSWLALEGMFGKTVRQTKGKIRRLHKQDNETTCSQAEICVIGKITQDYFINIKSMQEFSNDK